MQLNVILYDRKPSLLKTGTATVNKSNLNNKANSNSTSEKSNNNSGMNVSSSNNTVNGSGSNPSGHKRKLIGEEKQSAKERVKNQRLCGQSGIGTDFKVHHMILIILSNINLYSL